MMYCFETGTCLAGNRCKILQTAWQGAVFILGQFYIF